MAKQSFDKQLDGFRKKLNSAAASRKKQVIALRSKAAEAALNWVMSHEDRVNQFKSAVKGTPVAAALDKLLDLLKSEAKPAKAPAKKTAKKKAPARKAAKKAVKKAAKKTAKKK
jgi:DNA-binding protein HU-beta